MDEDRKKRVATFRFGVISDFVGCARLTRGEKELLLRQKCAREWDIPYSSRSRLSRSTILSWVRDYERGGRRIESLYPKDRSDRGKFRILDEEVAQAIISLRREFKDASVSILIKVLKERGIVDAWAELPHSTIYRFLHRQGLMVRPDESPRDRRRFEAEFPNDMWQSDSMHGPFVIEKGRRKKTFLFAFIDDHSRLIPHAQFYLSEKLDNYLDALRQALLKRGLPRKLYCDNGPAFRSHHLAHITASLGIALIHSRPYKPEGRGKCERLFRTIRAQFLSLWKGDSLKGLNEALNRWIDDEYHNRRHCTTGQTPLQRFGAHIECVRPTPPNLEDHFRKQAYRSVDRDRTISLNSRLYEAPVNLIGKRVSLLYHEHDPERVEVVFKGHSYGFLTSLNVHVNYRVRRCKDKDYIELEPIKGNYKGGKLPFNRKEVKT